MGTHLIHEIQKIQALLAELATCVEELLRQSLTAVATGDLELAKTLIEKDNEIDRMEIALEEECLKSLALYQPVASDLRYIITCLKLNTELERIGDLAVNIVTRCDSMNTLKEAGISVDFTPMGARTQEIVKETLDALFKLNREAAQHIIEEDDEIDDMHRDWTLHIADLCKSHPECSTALIYILGISRSLERVADSCTNIAEDIIYMLDGAIIRHQK